MNHLLLCFKPGQRVGRCSEISLGRGRADPDKPRLVGSDRERDDVRHFRRFFRPDVEDGGCIGVAAGANDVGEAERRDVAGAVVLGTPQGTARE